MLCAICVGINKASAARSTLLAYSRLLFVFSSQTRLTYSFKPKEKPTYVQQIAINRLVCVSLLLFHAEEWQKSKQKKQHIPWAKITALSATTTAPSARKGSAALRYCSVSLGVPSRNSISMGGLPANCLGICLTALPIQTSTSAQRSCSCICTRSWREAVSRKVKWRPLRPAGAQIPKAACTRRCKSKVTFRESLHHATTTGSGESLSNLASYRVLVRYPTHSGTLDAWNAISCQPFQPAWPATFRKFFSTETHLLAGLVSLGGLPYKALGCQSPLPISLNGDEVTSGAHGLCHDQCRVATHGPYLHHLARLPLSDQLLQQRSLLGPNEWHPLLRSSTQYRLGPSLSRRGTSSFSVSTCLLTCSYHTISQLQCSAWKAERLKKEGRAKAQPSHRQGMRCRWLHYLASHHASPCQNYLDQPIIRYCIQR